MRNPVARPVTHRYRSDAPIVGALLLGFFFLLIFSVRDKSVTADEIPHALGGYAAWAFDDYRFNPENGNVPQRLIGLPLWLGGTHFPKTNGTEWDHANEWSFGDRWFHGEGNNVATLLWRGRLPIAVVTVALAGLIWWWSRSIFGPRGAFISLVIAVFDPTLLAHGALMTSDATAAFLFLASTWAIWNILHAVTPARVLTSAVLVGLLFGTKMSAPLILIVAAILSLVRLIRNQPLSWRWRNAFMTFRSRRQQAVVLGAVALVHLLVAWAVVWSLFGFRYSSFSSDTGRERHAQAWELLLDRPDPLAVVTQVPLTAEQRSRFDQILLTLAPSGDAWASPRLEAAERIRTEILTPEQLRQLVEIEQASPRSSVVRFIENLRTHRLLPEAFLYGYAHVWKFSQMRTAFLNGQVSLAGWRAFFPYAFLVKTPLSSLLLIAAGILTLVFRRRLLSKSSLGSTACYEALPLVVLAAAHFGFAMSSHLNIGHRHLVTMYPPMFILVGAVGWWLPERWPMKLVRQKFGTYHRITMIPALVVLALVAALAMTTLRQFPNYLSYFNLIAGGSTEGFRHLVDSSLDWGQELPAIARYVNAHREEEPVYLSYFGRGDPASYDISAHSLYAYESEAAPPPLIARSFPAAEAHQQLQEFFRRHPDYVVAGSVRMPDATVVAMLIKSPAAWQLRGGTYVISATMLQPVAYDLDGPLGSWNARYERLYQELRRETLPFLSDDPNQRSAALGLHPLYEWARILKRFEAFRFARLTAWLRQREPDHEINYSVLVYRLTDADLARALDGPPVELGDDVPAEYAKTQEKHDGTE